MDQTKRIIPVAALVLIPGDILNYNSLLSVLHIRTGKDKLFEVFPIDANQLNRYFKQFNEETKELLLRFNDADIAFERRNLARKHMREKTGMTADKYMEKMTFRYFYDLFSKVAPAITQTPVYHKTINPKTGNYLTAKCRISTEQPTLSFEVLRDEQTGLYIEGLLKIADQILPLSECRRYKFLVESENVYYTLSYRDFVTLEWLHASKPEQYSLNNVLFSERIVQKLEENYPLNRNNHFSRNVIDSPPVSGIFLSELSDTMLMLSPRWIYEGIAVEGDWKAEHETIRNGVPYNIKRRQEEESAFVHYLKSLHPNFNNQSKYFYLSFAEAKKKQWFLKTYHSLLEQDIVLTGLEMLKHFRYSSHPPVTELTLHIDEIESEIIHLNCTVSFGKEKIPLIPLQKLLLSGQNSLLLKDNSIAVLPDDWIAQYSLLLKHCKVLPKDIISAPRWIWLCLRDGGVRQEIQESLSREWRSKWLLWQENKEDVYPLPQKINATLRPYQQKGFEWMCLLSEIGAGGILADDMGLGKTLQTIAFISRQQELHPEAKHIVICPASLIYNWSKEIAKFAPHLKALVYSGTQRNLRDFFEEEEAYSILIMSYGTLRSDIEQLKAIPWKTAILDESHNIKNLQAQVTRCVYQLAPETKLALSGTPVMNNTFDLYAQMNFLLPDLLGGQEFFRREYARPIDQEGNTEKIAALQSITAPFILRRAKEQVAKDLPEKTESILYCEMSEEQKEAYHKIKDQVKSSLFLGIKDTGFEKSKISILAGITKLRQVCGAPSLLQETSDCNEAIKIDVLMSEIENTGSSSKALVFSQFKGMLHLVAERCRQKNIPYFHFDGDTPLAERAAMVDQFQHPDNTTKLFLISLKSGNAGLNLTAADYVFLVDPWWNNAVQQQAIDRTHRIGQTKNVFAYKMICKDTIEEKIIALQERKQSLSEGLVSAEDGFVKNLSIEDVTYLFD